MHNKLDSRDANLSSSCLLRRRQRYRYERDQIGLSSTTRLSCPTSKTIVSASPYIASNSFSSPGSLSPFGARLELEQSLFFPRCLPSRTQSLIHLMLFPLNPPQESGTGTRSACSLSLSLFSPTISPSSRSLPASEPPLPLFLLLFRLHLQPQLRPSSIPALSAPPPFRPVLTDLDPLLLLLLPHPPPSSVSSSVVWQRLRKDSAEQFLLLAKRGGEAGAHELPVERPMLRYSNERHR
jgi:hypothetical protein